jgi:hypothetical protein
MPRGAGPAIWSVRVSGSALKTYRCRMRAAGRTVTIECVAPSAEAAAHVVARLGLSDRRDPWIQVVVEEWSGALGGFIDPGNVLIVSERDAPPVGVDRVVLSRAEYALDTAAG